MNNLDMNLTIEEIDRYKKYYMESDMKGIHYWISDSDILNHNYDNIVVFNKNKDKETYEVWMNKK